MQTIEHWVRVGQERLDKETDRYLEEEEVIDEDKDDRFMENVD